jgi:hypothetical protein
MEGKSPTVHDIAVVIILIAFLSQMLPFIILFSKYLPKSLDHFAVNSENLSQYYYKLVDKQTTVL